MLRMVPAVYAVAKGTSQTALWSGTQNRSTQPTTHGKGGFGRDVPAVGPTDRFASLAIALSVQGTAT